MSVHATRPASVARIPIGRMNATEAIANAVLFLASGKDSYITGVSISIDGTANLAAI